MAFELPKDSYSGKIVEVTLGSGPKAKKVGGQNAMPLCTFEGTYPNKPLVAMEVYDSPEAAETWPEAVKAPFADVLGDPLAWAKKCLDQYGADAICIQLKSTDPNGQNTSADQAAALVKKLADALPVPLIVWGSENGEKDGEVLAKVAEVCQGMNLLLGPATEDNYKKIGGAAIGYSHTVVAQTPIDVNMAKQLNILLGNLGVPADKIVMDPSTGALGYGIEYSYSVMERDRLTALKQGDDKMQLPLICDVAKYAWKTREAGISAAEEPSFGDAKTRGVLWESVTAADLLTAGADILILRHPESVRILKKIIDEVVA
ncbi:MAG: acetyl-CoA decarbonylase/synthase complex subunit delta [Deltaproteobacteria bacterium]|nr:acetyl-CoA decarbonylase/synthase complex subunit delta [Deltaproteobacteria bacterium]